MKLLTALISIIAFAISAKGQVNEQFQNKLWKEYKNKKLDTDKYKLDHKTDSLFKLIPEVQKQWALPPQQPMAVLKLPLKGKYLGSNEMGSEIYAMEPDNMPCLVPGKTFKYNMPVAGDEKSGGTL